MFFFYKNSSNPKKNMFKKWLGAPFAAWRNCRHMADGFGPDFLFI